MSNPDHPEGKAAAEEATKAAEETYSRREAAVDLLLGFKWFLVALAGLLVFLAWWTGWMPTIVVPRPYKIFGFALGLGALGAILPAKLIVDWLYNPERVYLVDIDPLSSDFALWELTPDQFAQMDLEEGELWSLECSGRAYSVRSYDPETNTAQGTYRGSADDLELLQGREEVREIRETLEKRARWGTTLRIQLSSIVRSVTIDVLSDMIETYERHATFKGERVSEAVEDAMEDHGLEDDDLRNLKEELDPRTEGKFSAESEPETVAQDMMKND